ncbi:hypothetical protein Nepgr_015658 [Nepenthes gracilis]|uniref:Uncharacterized protein n=1 Tax=Nepenthes gracilis TaxID=150966 RepID=A0AAD3SNN1_NEPGR|nr:hypothetical protein Nepgr_015658 [Nepenthes gracilis]
MVILTYKKRENNNGAVFVATADSIWKKQNCRVFEDKLTLHSSPAVAAREFACMDGPKDQNFKPFSTKTPAILLVTCMSPIRICGGVGISDDLRMSSFNRIGRGGHAELVIPGRYPQQFQRVLIFPGINFIVHRI